MPSLRSLCMPLLVALAIGAASVQGQVTHTPADCQQANQFLCQVQCGKVLIHCTGPGAGVLTEPLDEAQAVCNNGAIDFAANCQGGAAGGGAGAGAGNGGGGATNPPATQPAAGGGAGGAAGTAGSCAPNKDDVIACIKGECQPFFTVCNKGQPSQVQPMAPGTVCKSDANGNGVVTAAGAC